MNCKRCGARLPQGLEICPECGTRLQRQAKYVRCAACHQRSPVDLTVCPHCGRTLRPAGPPWAVWVAGAAVLVLAGFWGLDRLAVGRFVRQAADLQARVVNLVQMPDLATSPGVSASSTPTRQRVAAVAASETPTRQPSATALSPSATAVSSPSATPQPTAVPTAMPTAAPTATATAQPTLTPSPTATAQPTPTQPPTATAVPNPNRYYVVQNGDSLALIGERTGIDWQTIAQLNGINQRSMLHPGDKLLLPGSAGGPAPAPQAAAPASPKTYTVQSGDSFAAIAERFGLDWQDVARANGMNQSTMLQPGQKLIIPVPGAAAASTPAPLPAQPSPTPQPSLLAPRLTSPADGTPFQGGQKFVGLTWQPVENLPPGAIYRVRIQFQSNGVPQEQAWDVNALGFQVPLALWNAADQPGRLYTWSVTAISLVPDGKGGQQVIPLSPPSASHSFTWN